jgi:hypothetical protein
MAGARSPTRKVYYLVRSACGDRSDQVIAALISNKVQFLVANQRYIVLRLDMLRL